jgi:hypothetical protein
MVMSLLLSTGFLGGRPLGRLICVAWRSSSSASSDLAFLLAAVLFVFAVRVDETDAFAFAFAEAVMIFVCFEVAGSGSLALARVRRLGGERIVSWCGCLLLCVRDADGVSGTGMDKKTRFKNDLVLT